LDAWGNWQATNNQQPTTNNQQPTTNNQQPTTNNQQPTTDNWSEATSRSLENLRGLAAGQAAIRFS
jgi:hypothetical protein